MEFTYLTCHTLNIVYLLFRVIPTNFYFRYISVKVHAFLILLNNGRSDMIFFTFSFQRFDSPLLWFTFELRCLSLLLETFIIFIRIYILTENLELNPLHVLLMDLVFITVTKHLLYLTSTLCVLLTPYFPSLHFPCYINILQT